MKIVSLLLYYIEYSQTKEKKQFSIYIFNVSYLKRLASSAHPSPTWIYFVSAMF